MSRQLFALWCLFLALTVFGVAAAQPAAKQPAAQPVYLRVLMPDENATLLIDGRPTKQTGTKRIFMTPPLESGKTFNYTMTAKWESESNTEITRTRVVPVQAGKVVEVDLRTADDKNPDETRSLIEPPPEEVVEEMCKLANVGKDDVVFDLGCGDGRIVLTAVADYSAKRGVGIDSDTKLLKEAEDDAKELKVADRVAFRKQDMKAYKDFNDATVVMLSKGKEANLKLMPMLKKMLKPGTRIVSHNASMGDWKADKSITVVDDEKVKHTLHLWIIKK